MVDLALVIGDWVKAKAFPDVLYGLSAAAWFNLAYSVLADWEIVRAIYGDQFAGHGGQHIRFGPNATVTKEKPK